MIANGGERRYWRKVLELTFEAAEAEREGAQSRTPPFVHDAEWLRGRREICSFIQKVDRDKIGLYGSGLDEPRRM